MFFQKIKSIFRKLIRRVKKTWRNDDKSDFLRKGTGNAKLDKAIEIAGYSYDVKQDIFCSIMNPWQRKCGYCRLYDEAAAPLGMIIDCEPIYFVYNKKSWLIEFWKGQFDMVTGGEIGVYTKDADLDIPNVYTGAFYHSASDQELLDMSFTLNKNGKELFKREDKHWWLTGFKMGEFSEPSELTMDINITLKNWAMMYAFVEGLKAAGYDLHKDIKVDGNTVSFSYITPRTLQPSTRTPVTDWIIQRKNQLFCEKYQEITGPYDNIVDKVKAIEKQAPDLYKKVFNIGKSKQLFEIYEKMKDYLD